jgi:hypothetical protein
MRGIDIDLFMRDKMEVVGAQHMALKKERERDG